MHRDNCFITLTYSPEFVPADRSLNHRHFVLFFKRLRESLRRRWVSDARFGPIQRPYPGLLYFMGGEYGERDGRPHYHVCLFGFYPDDTKYWKTAESGFKIFTSAYLDSIWRMGAVYVGDLSFESASYVARYCVNAEKGVKVTDIFDIETGEIHFRTREYGRMSLNPPIAKNYLNKFGRDVFENDRVVVRGFDSPVPRYYDKYLNDIAPLYLLEHKDKRREKADIRYSQFLNPKEPFANIKARRRARAKLLVEEVVKRASISNLYRS